MRQELRTVIRKTQAINDDGVMEATTFNTANGLNHFFHPSNAAAPKNTCCSTLLPALPSDIVWFAVQLKHDGRVVFEGSGNLLPHGNGMIEVRHWVRTSGLLST